MKSLKKYLFFSTIFALVYKLYKMAKFWFAPTGGNEGFCAETKPSVMWYTASGIVCKWFFQIFNGFKIYNSEYLPEDKQFVTVANHASIMDGFIVAASVHVPVYIMVKKEAFEIPIKGWYLRKVLCFPVDRSKVDVFAIKRAMTVLNEGKNLGIFPEGTRNREGYVGEFHVGAIKFALKKRLPIVPMYIQNSHNFTPVGAILPRPVEMAVHFLPPVDTKALLAEGKSEQEILNIIREMICNKGTELMGYDVRAEAKKD